MDGVNYDQYGHCVHLGHHVYLLRWWRRWSRWWQALTSSALHISYPADNDDNGGGEKCNDVDNGDHDDDGDGDDGGGGDDHDGDYLLLLLLSTSPAQLQHIPLQTVQLCLKSWSLVISNFPRFSFSSQPISSEAKNFSLATKWLVRLVKCWKQTFKLSSSQSLLTRQLAAYPLDHIMTEISLFLYFAVNHFVKML